MPTEVQPPSLPPAGTSGPLAAVTRRIYRAQEGRELAKDFRWYAERTLAGRLLGGTYTRNRLLSEPVRNLATSDGARTDILHEYFLSPERLGRFLDACRSLIPPARAEFLNVTLRYVGADPVSALSYAPGPRIGAVMSFSQEISDRGEADMRRLTEALVDVALEAGGTYYLPYRPHARPDQLRRAYAGVERFASLKRHYDPALTFRNALWDTYLA